MSFLEAEPHVAVTHAGVPVRNTFLSLLTALAMFTIWAGARHLLQRCASLPCRRFSGAALGLGLPTGEQQTGAGMPQGCPPCSCPWGQLAGSRASCEQPADAASPLENINRLALGKLSTKRPPKQQRGGKKTRFHLQPFPKLCNQAAAGLAWLPKMETEGRSVAWPLWRSIS